MPPAQQHAPDDDPLTAVGERLASRGRAYEIRDENMLVLDSGVAQRLDDLHHAYRRARARGAPPRDAAETVLAVLEAHELRLDADVGQRRVRLRLTHPSELDPAHTVPGPAGLIVYPVLDGPDAATRLGPAQMKAGGGIERVCVASLGPTLNEPVRVEAMGRGIPGWRVTGDIYTASRLLDVAGLLRELGSDPAAAHLVAVPSSREVWVFRDPAEPTWLRRVANQAAMAYAASRGRVSRSVYRWDGATLSEAVQPGSSDIGP